METGSHRNENLFFRFTLCSTWIFYALFSYTACNTIDISGINPSTGGLAGDVKVTITGSGFSGQFSLDDGTDIGNSVYLVSPKGREYACTVHKEGSTPNQIMFYTPSGLNNDESYYVNVVVDGRRASGGQFHAELSHTPWISSVTPQTGPPGTLVKIQGRIFTDRYSTDIATSTNGNTQTLQRVYVGPHLCDLYRENGSYYGLYVNGDRSDYGVIECKTTGSTVGFSNVSYIVDPPYGRSLAGPNLYHVSYKDDIYLYQMYTDITSISPTKGSVSGGLILTIYGNYFDHRPPYKPPRAYIDDTPCEITEVVPDEYIKCIVPAEQTNSRWEGNRGVIYEYWTNTSVGPNDLDSVLLLDSSESGYHSETLDETNMQFDDINGIRGRHVGRMRFYFRPPHSGQYQFFMYANERAKLFIDGVTKMSVNQRTSERLALDERRKYLFEIVQYSNNGHSYIHLGAKFFNTTFTNNMIQKAVQEQQRIKIVSTVTYDIQDLEFEILPQQIHVNEVQTVAIETAGYFRFGMFGVYTEPLDVLMTEDMIQEAIMAMPIWGTNETVYVEKVNTTTPTYRLTFDSRRGDFPNLEVIEALGSVPVSYSVTEDTAGVPDLDSVALMLDGVVSEPFSIELLNAGNISLKRIIDDMFTSKCPQELEGHKGGYYNSFESNSKFHVRKTEAFCGRYVLKNPETIYDNDDGLLLSDYGTLCFAYKGFLQNMIRIQYSYKPDSRHYTNQEFYHFFKTNSPTVSDTWYYTCVDLYSIVLSENPGRTGYYINKVWVYRLNDAVDVYIDSVYIGNQQTTDDPDVFLRRRRTAHSRQAFVNQLNVSPLSTGQFRVTIEPFDCGYDFPLFELANKRELKLSDPVLIQTSTAATTVNGATQTSTAATTVISATQTSTAATTVNGATTSSTSTFLSTQSTANVLSVTRISEASPPVSGLFDIMFREREKKGLNVSLTAAEFDKELESIEEIGYLQVTKTGDCAKFDLTIKFLTLPGDLPQMKVNYSQLKGRDARGIIVTDTEGYLYYDPFMGDMISTVHSTPQVRLFMNDVPTACSGDCSFQWDHEVTPVITEIDPQSGTSAQSTSVVISGTGFSDDISENSVTIGGVECTVTAAISTSITCNVGNGPLGSHPVRVSVDCKGLADGYVEFTYTSDISSISPTSGSLGGGIQLTIAGYGFNENAIVSINGVECDVVSVRADEIDCVVPASNTDGTFDVQMDQGYSLLSFSGFTYDTAATATVTSVIPETLNVTGGNLTVLGSSFTSVTGSVSVGLENGHVTFWSDSRIDLVVENLECGRQELKVDLTSGLAVNATDFELPKINVEFKTTNVYPLRGSLLGGTNLTITGSGFGCDISNVKVAVGPVNCHIILLTNSEIVCFLEHTGNTHHVTNKGVDPAFGVYYAFDKPFITIEEGDFVEWSWETPSFVNNIFHSIIEVGSPSSLRQKQGGFSSGIPSRNGAFRHQFVRKGLFYVWSGFVDEWGIKNYAGTVAVVEANSTSGKVSVHVGKAEAEHVTGDLPVLVDSTVCNHISTGKTGCTEKETFVNDASIFTYDFLACYTPIVNSVNANNGTTKTNIMITGEGFSSTNCQNEVFFGGQRCNVTMASEFSLTCNIEKYGGPQIAVLHQLELRVNNRGFARVNITDQRESGFALLPNVESIFPVTGSEAGGTRLTIKGFGFEELPSVTIGQHDCAIMESTYSEIICETPACQSEEEKQIVVYVYAQGYPIQAKCETETGKCAFIYKSDLTPTVSAISPTMMSGKTSFNITGTLLGNDTAELDVTIADVLASVIEATDEYIVVSVDNLPAGNNDVLVRVKDYGKASGTLTVFGSLTISEVVPTSGSIYGNTTITILGNGFVEKNTMVSVGGASCGILSTSLSKVICTTQAHEAGVVSVIVSSNGLSKSSSSYHYATASSPSVTSIDPISGYPGDILTIYGSNFRSGDITVSLGQSACGVVSEDIDRIECIVGHHPTGIVDVSVHICGLGTSNSNVQFAFQLSLSSITPTQGGIAGGQDVLLTGTGIDSAAVATICGKPCLLQTATTTTYLCRTPANTDITGVEQYFTENTQHHATVILNRNSLLMYALKRHDMFPVDGPPSCDVSIFLNGLNRTLPDAYQYISSLTPTISNVNPKRGGTGGGTVLTISGKGFGSDSKSTVVDIDGESCQLLNITDTEIRCITAPHSRSIQTKVEVQVSNNGIADEVSKGDADFQYIDVWSSHFTWGAGPLPQTGEFVVIPSGTTILLDIDTPILSFLLIKGGKLIFDEKDIELQANVILITDGGQFQIGTEVQPFQHQATVTLHGHVRSKELPIYGTKTLAVRNGTLDLHGAHIPLTWTVLSRTAEKGSNKLHLKTPVKWKGGDKIVIASTGHRLNQYENEKKTIAAVSEDGMTLTLATPLKAEHVGVKEVFEGRTVEMRAEVGLLTHNVVVRGNDDPQWNFGVKSCPAGFQFGHFGAQKCNTARVGDEIGSNQFGVVIFVHSPVQDTQYAQIRMSNTEVTFAGQIFRSGRHPLQFYRNGNMSGSYVRSCSFHNTFNRAINIQGSQNIPVEHNVIHDILGGGIVLVDGSETGITLEYNLAVQVTGCATLENDDLAPASFSLSNPNNTVQHNAAAGGTHYGYWYRLSYHSVGASYKHNGCAKYVPLRIFQNNSAHTFRESGLYIFKDYFPRRYDCSSSESKLATFDWFNSWNNDIGVKVGNIGTVQFRNFTLMQNHLAGFELDTIRDMPMFPTDSPSVQSSVIVAKTTVNPRLEQGCTQGGIVLPLGRGFRVMNVSFVNFNESNCVAFRWTSRTRHCPLQIGGFTYHLESMAYINTPNIAFFAFVWQGIFLDKDGTSTGKAGNWTVLPTTGTLPHDCEPAPEFSIGVNASACPSKYNWHKYIFNYNRYDRKSYYIRGRTFNFTNQYGNSSVPYSGCGWMCALLSNTTYKFSFENMPPQNNLSFYGTFYDFKEDDFLFITMDVPDFPDWFSVKGERINASSGVIEHTNGSFGAWNWNNLKKKIKFLVTSSELHAEMVVVDIPISFRIYKCFYMDCVPPPDPNKTPPAMKKPLNFQLWHDASIWLNMSDGYVTNIGKTGRGLPQDFDNVKILPHTWVLVNFTAICKLRNLLLYGTLEFAGSPEAVYEIEAEFIIIIGGRLIIGWPDNPFEGLATISLRTNHSSPKFNLGTGAPLERKTIGVFGGLDLIGKDKGVTWTYLASTANAGSRRIDLLEKVQWSKGDEIVISPSGFGPGQSEAFKIISVDNDEVTLSLNDTLRFQHIVHREVLPNGRIKTLRAAVGLLSRNIKITRANNDKDTFGARVLVGLTVDKQQQYSGYARLSNVEFDRTGQRGVSDLHDPRSSLVFLDAGNVNHIKPSLVTNCSFHKDFNTAVSVIGTGNLHVTDNVVYGNSGHGIKTASLNTKLLRNLVIAAKNIGIEALQAVNITLQDNLVSGCGTAFRVPALACDETTDRYKDNNIYSNLQGAVISPRWSINAACAKISGFTAWKNNGFGVRYDGDIDALFEQIVLIENEMGAGANVGSPYTADKILNKTVFVRNTTFIGLTSSFSCGDMMWSVSNRNLPSPNGMVGLVFPTYNVIGGMTKIENVTFAKYGDSVCLKNYAVATNLARNDIQRPIESENVTLVDVAYSNKILFQRQNIGIYYQCFRADCDIFGIAFFKDLDGTFLDHNGIVIPNSGYDAIDYNRIPREMVTMLNGTRIPYEDIAPNKGVVRNDNCFYQMRWQAYECKDDLNYKMLVIQNMDRDAKYRQISPVALLADGYIHLIDVPLDHGHCPQYTCRRKRPFFIALVATDKSYLMHFTRTTPRHMRYSILNAGQNDGIKLTVWYSRPNRLDVLVNGEFVIATNARFDENGRYIMTMPEGNEFEPQVKNATGTNYFDRSRGEVTFIVKGPAQIDIISQKTIIVSFGLPAMSVSEFYGQNIIENLAAFLDIPLTKVRIVNIVSASVNGRRKRSEESDTYVEIEIGDGPGPDLNSTLPDSIDYSTLSELASLIVDECQLGDMSDILGELAICGTLEFPSDDSEIVSVIYNNLSPDHLYFFYEPEAEYEGILLKTQPNIRAVDINGFNVTELGTEEFPWQITVSLRNETGHPLAVLYGNLTINSSHGWFNFTDLAISHSGSDYVLDFNVSYPNRADHFSLTSNPFDVAGRPLKIGVYNQTDMDVFTDDQFAVTLHLLDQYTDEIVQNIKWRDHRWSADVSMLRTSVFANLTGMTNGSFDEETGCVTFPDLSITGVGMYYLKFRVFSDPPEYNLTFNWPVAIRNPTHANKTVEETTIIALEFDAVFEDVLPTTDEVNSFEQTYLTYLANFWSEIEVINGSAHEGSIIVELTIGGTTEDVNATVYALCEDIYNGTEFLYNNYSLAMSPYLRVNDTAYYGVKCGDIPSEETDNKETAQIPLRFIAIMSLTGFVLLIVLIAVVAWRCLVTPKTKIQDINIKQTTTEDFVSEEEPDWRKKIEPW